MNILSLVTSKNSKTRMYLKYIRVFFTLTSLSEVFDWKIQTEKIFRNMQISIFIKMSETFTRDEIKQLVDEEISRRLSEIQIVCNNGGYYGYDIYDNYDKLINKKKLKLLHAVMDNDPYKLIEGLHGDEFMNMIYVKLDPGPL